ncbi:hypothetical protein PUN28_020101 [Cardiocondyla obscurior]|uniref:Peptidase S1 domain-containing protein n=1 Tax=Cardiocondyla obscurior TaxID=286306 RepID=A0AAW2ECA4_9HYME
MKIFLSIAICLIVCRHTQSQYVENAELNDTKLYYAYDKDAVLVDTDNYDDADSNRIAGGKYADIGDFPYMALLYHILDNGIIASLCGGTILSERWVLTASHCVLDSPVRFVVTFGIVDKFDIPLQGVSMMTNEVFVHPKNDIALLHMPQDIPFSTAIKSIKLAYHPESFANVNAIVVGWGKDQMFGGSVRKLKYATLPILSNNECNKYWWRLPVSDEHVCTAAGYGQAACQGDSGGPLVVMQNGQHVQVGIVSYGDGACPGNMPGVFIRVSSFNDWIHQVMKLY